MNTRADFLRQCTQRARTAGLHGAPLPEFQGAGKWLPGELRQINDAYNDARNEHAAGKHKKDE